MWLAIICEMWQMCDLMCSETLTPLTLRWTTTRARARRAMTVIRISSKGQLKTWKCPTSSFLTHLSFFVFSAQTPGRQFNTRRTFQLEFQLEKSLEFWLDYTGKKFKNWLFRHVSESKWNLKSIFQLQLKQKYFYWIGSQNTIAVFSLANITFSGFVLTHRRPNFPFFRSRFGERCRFSPALG